MKEERPTKKEKVTKGKVNAKTKQGEAKKTGKGKQERKIVEIPRDGTFITISSAIISSNHALTPHTASPPPGVRRGLRHRYRPLDWWRQERVVYGRRESGVSFVPHIKEIIRVRCLFISFLLCSELALGSAIFGGHLTRRCFFWGMRGCWLLFSDSTSVSKCIFMRFPIF
jgi:hypothetical protein